MPHKVKKTCIVGAGGFGKETLCCLIDANSATKKNIEDIACFMVDNLFYKESRLLGVDVIRRSEFDPSLYNVIVAVGDPIVRKKIVESLPKETTYTTVIHPSAVLSEWVEIGEGSIITAGAILTCDIKIGKHAQLNLHSTIGHDCKIGNYFTAAPAANINGSCTIGDCVYFGANSSLKEKITVCSNVSIGMGAVVIKNITEEGVYIGNPAKKLK
jgi:sugar O-acyltransferase (sialic acid O-acetyltransferase NeuD family)